MLGLAIYYGVRLGISGLGHIFCVRATYLGLRILSLGQLFLIGASILDSSRVFWVSAMNFVVWHKRWVWAKYCEFWSCILGQGYVFWVEAM